MRGNITTHVIVKNEDHRARLAMSAILPLSVLNVLSGH